VVAQGRRPTQTCLDCNGITEIAENFGGSFLFAFEHGEHAAGGRHESQLRLTASRVGRKDRGMGSSVRRAVASNASPAAVSSAAF